MEKTTKHKKPPQVKPLQDKPYKQGEMPALVDSKKQQLDIGRITVIAAYHTKSTVPPNMVAMALLLELQQPGTKHVQFGNTLFIVHEAKNAPRRVVFRGLNADTANNYANNAMEFLKWAYDEGYDVGATQFSDPAILRLIRFISKSFPREGMGYSAQKLPGNEYAVLVKFGPYRD